jgi:hypothetical protein
MWHKHLTSNTPQSRPQTTPHAHQHTPTHTQRAKRNARLEEMMAARKNVGRTFRFMWVVRTRPLRRPLSIPRLLSLSCTACAWSIWRCMRLVRWLDRPYLHILSLSHTNTLSLSLSRLRLMWEVLAPRPTSNPSNSQSQDRGGKRERGGEVQGRERQREIESGV